MNLIKNITAIFAFCCGTLCVAQQLPPCARPDLNKLYLPPDSSAFMRLFDKMAALNADAVTRVSITHLGGSHIQAGIWSNAFAAALQTQFKTIGGGYFGFPYKLAKTNGQYYLNTFSSATWKKCRAVSSEFCLPLGMSGLSVATNDSSGTFVAALNNKSACRFVNNIKVFHNFNPSFKFELNSAKAGNILRSDNLQEGYTLFSFENPLDSIPFVFQRLDTNQRDFILYGFSLENSLTSGIFLAGLGLNGAAATTILRSSELSRQLPALQTDLYILSYGVNDTQAADYTPERFYNSYDSLIKTIRAVNPDAAIILTTTTDNYRNKKTLNKKTDTARDVMFTLMKDKHVAIWDLYEIMGGAKSIVKWSQVGMASKDRVHFTSKGYNVLGNLLFEAVMSAYWQSRKQIK